MLHILFLLFPFRVAVFWRAFCIELPVVAEFFLSLLRTRSFSRLLSFFFFCFLSLMFNNNDVLWKKIAQKIDIYRIT